MLNRNQMQNNLKKIEEVAWAKMSKILDKEMPVERKKRRYFFLSLSAAVIISVALFGILFIDHYNDRGNRPITSTLNMPYSIKGGLQSNTSNPVFDQSNSKTDSENSILNIDENNEALFSQSRPNTTDNIIPTAVTTENLLSIESALDKISGSNEAEAQSAESVAVNELETSIQKENNNKIESPEEAWKSMVEVKYLSLLLRNVTHENRKESIDHLPKYSSNNEMHPYVQKTKKHFGIEAGLGIKMIVPYNSVMPMAGIGLIYAINEKWSFVTGAYYSLAPKSTDSLLVSRNQFNVYSNILEELNTKNNGTTDLKNSDIQRITLFNQQILHLPFGLEYNLSKHFSVKAGIYYDRIISKNSSYTVQLPKTISTIPESNEYLNFVDNKIISQNFNWIGGISYKPTFRLNFSVEVMGNNKFISGSGYSKDQVAVSGFKSNSTLPFVQVMAKYRFVSF
jgi:hypothetical protein